MSELDSNGHKFDAVSTVLCGLAAGVVAELYLADYWALPVIAIGCIVGTVLPHSFRQLVALRFGAWLIDRRE